MIKLILLTVLSVTAGSSAQLANAPGRARNNKNAAKTMPTNNEDFAASKARSQLSNLRGNGIKHQRNLQLLMSMDIIEMEPSEAAVVEATKCSNHDICAATHGVTWICGGLLYDGMFCPFYCDGTCIDTMIEVTAMRDGDNDTEESHTSVDDESYKESLSSVVSGGEDLSSNDASVDGSLEEDNATASTEESVDE